ncbi:MAG: photosystem II assembly protein [Oscillatoria sp. PMC 1051.18]|nr:photosystem II assembly protein [Oscillatoria sp. PMC 1050.18]MEC5028808.1 photosystem II assembly protein [Oscillatoria sp. PMC 1051.18]
MSNILVNWWRSRQFQAAIKRGNERQAQQILQVIETSGAKLSLLQKLYKKQLKTEQSLAFYQRELAAVGNRLQATLQEDNYLIPEQNFIQFIRNSFKFIEHDKAILQCTGIEAKVFDDFENNLAQFLLADFQKRKPDALKKKLNKAIQDLEQLKRGGDPKYDLSLSPHVYLMKYFLENVYCSYLAWFLIYQTGLLPKNLKILDIAAGPGTVAYGLALLLQSMSSFENLPQTHISYYSLEQQPQLQFRGLQFWRHYIEPQQKATNAYFRFDTADIFDYASNQNKIPNNFFDFIVISHCFFYDHERRIKANKIYQSVFQEKLAQEGYVLLIVQGRKLFNSYNIPQTEDIYREQDLIQMFLTELGLQLEWYKYLTSTDRRTPIGGTNFYNFARQNLPDLKYMNPLKRKYLNLGFDANYVVDDYVILAKR